MPGRKIIQIDFRGKMEIDSAVPQVELAEGLMPIQDGYTFFPKFQAGTADDKVMAATAEGSNSGFIASIPDTPAGATPISDDLHDYWGVIGEDAPQTAVFRLDARELVASGGTTYTHSTTSTASLGMWDFCQFGTQIIATCYTDPVKAIDLNDGTPAWANLITSTQTPKARFCDVVKNHLVLAKIDNTGGNPAGVFPDMVWWSANDNIANFNIPSQEYGGYYRLNRTPGVITGMIGGEFALVFKARETWRLDLGEIPDNFLLRRLSHGTGCPFPKSIVRAGEFIYFWTEWGIAVTDGASPPKPLPGLSAIKNLIWGRQATTSDANFHRQLGWPGGEGSYDTTNDDVSQVGGPGYLGQFVNGAYDPTTDTIWWFYVPTTGEVRILVYHVFSEKFTVVTPTIVGGTGTLNGIVQTPPVFGSQNKLDGYANRQEPQVSGIVFVSDANHLVMPSHNSFVTTARIVTGAFRVDNQDAAQINKVKLLFTTQESEFGITSSGTDPAYSVEIHYDYAPNFPSATSETIASTAANSEGELLFNQTNGQWFRIEITFTPGTNLTSAIMGLEVDAVVEGDYA